MNTILNSVRAQAWQHKFDMVDIEVVRRHFCRERAKRAARLPAQAGAGSGELRSPATVTRRHAPFTRLQVAPVAGRDHERETAQTAGAMNIIAVFGDDGALITAAHRTQRLFND